MHFAPIIRTTLLSTLLVAKTLAQDEDENVEKPKPLVIPASQHFEGNDGPWSTFYVRVGTREQHVRVTVSTASPWTMVVVDEGGCSKSVFTTTDVPIDCSKSRGKTFKMNDSSTWDDLGIYGINQDGLGLEANLGYSQRVQFGLETLGIGLTGPTLEKQPVGGIATPHPFYLGVFGLNTQPLNFTTLGNETTQSFLTTLKDQKKIPSLSWSYTAGAKYRLKTVYGQLILSGYDTSRFEENSVSFTMAEDITRDLVVALQSISYSGSQSATLLSEPIDIMIDSTDPNLWLPEEVCDKFEEAFGLTLDEESGLYLINDTHRNALLDEDAEVSFRLGDVKGGGETVSITLPFAAFDLVAENPLVSGESSHYFPLKRANSSEQYTLGRVFLQEAYLSADYERKVFNVSACVWNEGADENIVAITSKDDPDGNNIGGSSSSGGLSGGQIAGIVVGCVVAFLLAAGALTLCILRKRRKWLKEGFSKTVPTAPPEPDMAVLTGPVFNEKERGSVGDGRHGSESTAGGTVATGSTPYSADDVTASGAMLAAGRASGSGSGSRSTPSSGLRSGFGSQSTPGTTTTGNSDSVVEGRNELDGRVIKPDTELDGREVQPRPAGMGKTGHSVYELPGSGSVVAGGGSREVGHGQAYGRELHVPARVDERDEREGWGHHRDNSDGSSPRALTHVSTLDSSAGGDGWGRDSERGDSALVSPTSARNSHYGARPF